jgi:hypothetical protein
VRIPVGGGDNNLSDEAKHLAYRFLIGEINDLQLNFLAHQKHLDKEKILLFIESVRQTGKVLSFIVVAVLLLGFSTLIYFLIGR